MPFTSRQHHIGLDVLFLVTWQPVHVCSAGDHATYCAQANSAPHCLQLQQLARAHDNYAPGKVNSVSRLVHVWLVDDL